MTTGTSGGITAIACLPAVVPERPTVAGHCTSGARHQRSTRIRQFSAGPGRLRGLLVAQVTRVRATYLELENVATVTTT
jgi:hypothetical protein